MACADLCFRSVIKGLGRVKQLTRTCYSICCVLLVDYYKQLSLAEDVKL